MAPVLIEQATDCHLSDQVSFWAALIIVTARSAGCTHLLAEDLEPGQVICGVRVVHPSDGEPLH